MDNIDRLAQEASDAIDSWFENYDWDGALTRMMEKYSE